MYSCLRSAMFIERRFYNAPVIVRKTRPAAVFDYGMGISAVDSVYDRREQTAVHLLVEEGRAAVIDTGTAHAVPHVMAALEARGIPPANVDYVILTHVHL